MTIDREVMNNLHNAISTVSEYRFEDFVNNESVRKDAFEQVQKLVSAFGELEKILGLKQRAVKVGDLTLSQVRKICIKRACCHDVETNDTCPFYNPTCGEPNFCDPTFDSFDKDRVVCVFEEDLK